jgi:hypothetical protein
VCEYVLNYPQPEQQPMMIQALKVIFCEFFRNCKVDIILASTLKIRKTDFYLEEMRFLD